jgi:hypothetical protein
MITSTTVHIRRELTQMPRMKKPSLNSMTFDFRSPPDAYPLEIAVLYGAVNSLPARSG